MASSYDRVNDSFFAHKDWAALVERYREALKKPLLEAAPVYEVGTQYVNGASVTVAIARFMARIDVPRKDDEKDAGLVKRATAECTAIYGRELFAWSEMRQYFLQHWATKACPTYNCKEEKAWEKFRESAGDRLANDLRYDIPPVAEVIAAEWGKFTEAELEAGKAHCYHRHAIRQIKSAVLAWHDKVPPEVLKEALDEVVAHAILES